MDNNTSSLENKNGRHNNPRLLSFMGEYVGWEEVWVCGEKGRREVHYYLKKKDGSADLAVVGKEKSLRHISYRYVVPVADKESRVYVKLKSRREVVNWLRSIAPELAEQEEDDLDRIKEESRRIKRPILEKYRSPQSQQKEAAYAEVAEAKDHEELPSQSVTAQNAMSETPDALTEGPDIFASEPSFSVGKSTPQNDPPVPERVSGTAGVGEATPKCERSPYAFSDDIFGESPAGVRKTGNKTCDVVQTMPSFMWVGSPWICRKKRMHYPSFQRNGVHIYVHDFIYVLAEEDKRLVAYLEDIYEDSRGNKMVVVRWFHKIDEVDVVLPRTYNDREIFFSLCLQDLSIECVDGLATVLSPQHYKKFLNEARHTQLEPFVCYMLFEDDGVKPFDFTEVKGYWKQDILRCLSLTTQTKRVRYSDVVKGGETSTDAAVPRPKKRLCRSNEVDEYLQPIRLKFGDSGFHNRDNNLTACEGGKEYLAASTCQKDASIIKFEQHLTVGSQVEVLSQDSGIRGCWYRATIVKKHNDKVKVQYEDIKDAIDESKNLEEWIFASKLAVPDEYGIRFTGRSIIRPILTCRQYSIANNVNIGSMVDVWWHDGWWEGIVVKKDSDNNAHVYFPGEKQELAVGHDDMRNSQEWLNNRWNKLNERPDVVSSLSLPELKRSIVTCSSSKPDLVITFNEKDPLDSVCKDFTSEKNESRCGSRPRVVIKPKTIAAAPDLTKDNLLAQLRWKSSGKRCVRRSHVHKLNYGLKPKMNGAVDTRVQTSEKFKISSSSRHDPDYCKSVPTPTPLFSSSAVPNFSSLVMSR